MSMSNGAAIDRLRVHPAQLTHAACKVGPGNFHGDMVVAHIWHHAWQHDDAHPMNGEP